MKIILLLKVISVQEKKSTPHLSCMKGLWSMDPKLTIRGDAICYYREENLGHYLRVLF